MRVERNGLRDELEWRLTVSAEAMFALHSDAVRAGTPKILFRRLSANGTHRDTTAQDVSQE